MSKYHVGTDFDDLIIQCRSIPFFYPRFAQIYSEHDVNGNSLTLKRLQISHYNVDYCWTAIIEYLYYNIYLLTCIITISGHLIDA